MSSIKIVLPGQELDLTIAPYLNESVITEIYVDGIVGTYTAESLYQADDNIAVANIYSATDGACVQNMPVFAVGTFNKIYNSSVGSNIRVQIEGK